MRSPEGRKLRNVIDVEWRPELAYVVGLITSDGCLRKDSKRISFVSKDHELVMLYQDSLGLTKTPRLTEKGESSYLTVEFKSQQFYTFLRQIGLTPAKSKTMKSVAVPDLHFADFLRGLFDGDGTFWTWWDKRWSASFVFHIEIASASPKLLNWLKSNLTRLYGVRGFIKNGQGVQILRYSKGDSRALFGIMYYQDDLPFLTRKYESIKKALDFDEKLKQGKTMPR